MLSLMCEKFRYDWLRNERALGNGKFDNNKKKNNVRSRWGPVSVSNKIGPNTDLCGTLQTNSVGL